MRAVVLVGGFGTRLRPLTLDTPKQMLPVVDRPMIEWVVEHLGRHGIDEAVLALGYRPEPFREHYADGVCAGVHLRYVVEDEPLDTAGAVRHAATEAGIDERFLVLNGDVLTDVDLGAMVAFHDERGAEGTIHLHRVTDPSRYGVVPLDEQGAVLEFVEKPAPGEAPADWINAGTYVLEASVLSRIAPAGRVSIERETFPVMAAEGVLYGFPVDGYWIDTGTPEAYVQAQLDLTSGARDVALPAIDPSATVADAAVADAVVMAGAVVEPSAVVHRAAVLPGAVVERGARVDRAVIGPGARVGCDAIVEGWSIIGPGTVVGRGERLDGARRPDTEEGT